MWRAIAKLILDKLENEDSKISMPHCFFFLLLTAPKLRAFVATALTNNSLLLEWELEFDGGYPVTNFQITIEAQNLRQRRQAASHLSLLLNPEQAEAGSLVTQVLSSGVAYAITARLENAVGRVEQETSGKLSDRNKQMQLLPT